MTTSVCSPACFLFALLPPTYPFSLPVYNPHVLSSHIHPPTRTTLYSDAKNVGLSLSFYVFMSLEFVVFVLFPPSLPPPFHKLGRVNIYMTIASRRFVWLFAVQSQFVGSLTLIHIFTKNDSFKNGNVHNTHQTWKNIMLCFCIKTLLRKLFFRFEIETL